MIAVDGFAVDRLHIAELPSITVLFAANCRLQSPEAIIQQTTAASVPTTLRIQKRWIHATFMKLELYP